MSNTRVIGVFEVTAEMDCYTPTTNPSNPDIRWLLSNLAARADKELGIEQVNVAVNASEDGTIYDILLNDRSVGYFALRNFVDTLDNLKLPTLVTHGPEDLIALQELAARMEHRIYVVPLFGELFDENC